MVAPPQAGSGEVASASLTALQPLLRERVESSLPDGKSLLGALVERRWKVLDHAASLEAPLALKACFTLLAAIEAARSLREASESALSFRGRFLVDGATMVLSPAGPLQETLGFTGPVGISWEAATPVASARWDVLGLSGPRDWGDILATLVKRHGWQIPEVRQARFAARARAPRVYGLSRHELLSLLSSPEGRALGVDAPAVCEQLYPFWKPHALGLTLSYYCNAACAHCYNASGVRRPRECLQWSELAEDLSDWVRVGVTDIGLSGGEPFLFPETLLEIVRELKRLGVPLISPFTNGFWGADTEQARSLLLSLRDMGFGSSPRDQIKISTGEFHQRDVPLEHVLNVCELHAEVLGTRPIVDVAQVRDPEALRQVITRARERGLHERIQWYGRAAVSNSGRAKGWYRQLPSVERGLDELRCPIRGSAALYPEREWVYCSSTSYPASYRSIGELGTEGPLALLARAQFDPRIPYWQFGTFADYLRDHPHPDLEPSARLLMPTAGTPCGMCRKVFPSPHAQAGQLRQSLQSQHSG